MWTCHTDRVGEGKAGEREAWGRWVGASTMTRALELALEAHTRLAWMDW